MRTFVERAATGRAGLFGLREDAIPEELRGRVRARQAQAVLSLTPVVMSANALNALAVLLVFVLEGEPTAMVWPWTLSACLAAAWFLENWRRRRARPVPTEVGERVLRRMVVNAGALGLLWCYPSLVLLPGASSTAQAFLVVIAAGMTAGGVSVFYTAPRAAIVYATPQLVSAFVGLSQADIGLFAGGAVVAVSYLLVVLSAVSRHAAVFLSEIAGRFELEARNRRIEELMARTDVEARRREAAAFRRLEEAQKMEALGQLTGGMAHDFNNILTVIRGNAELLQETSAAEERDALLADLVGATERGADLIQKMLAFARRQPLRPEAQDAGAVGEEVASMLRRTLPESITVEVVRPEGLWPVLADRAQLEAALVNLALNARDAMPGGGRLTIACRNRRLSETEAAEAVEGFGYDLGPGDYVDLEVIDQGSGMSEETAARAFEPFFTTKATGAGTGLGLSMVLGFARQSHGFVRIRSRPGAGTRATLTLPRADRPPKVPQEPADAPAPEKTGATILLVEDQADVGRSLASSLRSLGYRPVGAQTAEEAEDLIANGLAPQAVLSDIVLPGRIDGIELARRLRGGEPPLPVVLMSGFPDPRGEARQLGEAGPRFLRKPFSRASLARALNDALRE